ncbi:hydrogenase nickel incorporation protein HypB [Aliiroseovarius subalbicans]|uniref:hydrogenase nickel incorporation protein HypB n=1 Tax=Aliiroseovarius subalbicans TaxID=2925840 RepID=UPI001F5A97C6|nr:hydrogenase nickel incorporation protein HypB [Aliiroseovarius subalbicans]MCI2397812.1 hydrogenase nickel incorporation protein HypB [Aliiroseovarius subalbicans]
MCATCGCGHDEVHVDGHVHAPGMDKARVVQIEQDILGRNDHMAAHNREHFERADVLALNLVSSPGSGKTTLLTRTITAMESPAMVIEGDQQTSLDADRIRETGAKAVQVNTGKGCHLDADMVHRALHDLDPDPGTTLFIENVGNLVCPAGFDLGEAARVVILSVTEGDDKPLKYPDMFHSADLMVLNKSDLLPYVPFDVDACITHARRINPGIEVLTLSALSGAGMGGWLDWIAKRRAPQARSA